jgi:leucyl/phenylalanyl-tRNA--protein transferase
VEAWQDGELAGGLYGVVLERFFFGESMFQRIPDASKVVLVKLCRYLAAHRFELLDCQVPNPHLFRMGAIQMSRAAFLDRLRQGGLGPTVRPARVLLPATL